MINVLAVCLTIVVTTLIVVAGVVIYKLIEKKKDWWQYSAVVEALNNWALFTQALGKKMDRVYPNKPNDGNGDND
jgi:hypothetical protein